MLALGSRGPRAQHRMLANAIAIFLVFGSTAVLATAPIATTSNYTWNLASAGVMVQAAGLDPTRWFANVNSSTNYTLVPADPGWCVLDLSNFTTLGRVRLVRNSLPELYGGQFFNVTLEASNPEGSAGLHIYASLPPPIRPLMYPITDPTSPLAVQTARQSNTWFTDVFPPQQFAYYGDFGGKSDVLELGLGKQGQPDARVTAFNNASLSDYIYNKQGRRYSFNQDIPAGVGITVTANVFIPGQWIDAAPNTSACFDGAGCGRAAWFEVELGLSDSGFIQPVLTARMGFDSRYANLSGDNSYLFATLGGPLLEGPRNASIYPYSPLGTYLMDAPGRFVKPVIGWANALRRDSWNEFSLTLQHFPYDTILLSNGSARNCQETMRIEWFLNGHRTFYPYSTDVGVTVEPCVKDVDGSLVATSVNSIRDVIISGWTVPQNSTANVSFDGYTTYWSGVNVYRSDVSAAELLPPQPPSPPPMPPRPPSPTSPTSSASNYYYYYYSPPPSDLGQSPPPVMDPPPPLVMVSPSPPPSLLPSSPPLLQSSPPPPSVQPSPTPLTQPSPPPPPLPPSPPSTTIPPLLVMWPPPRPSTQPPLLSFPPPSPYYGSYYYYPYEPPTSPNLDQSSFWSPPPSMAPPILPSSPQTVSPPSSIAQSIPSPPTSAVPQIQPPSPAGSPTSTQSPADYYYYYAPPSPPYSYDYSPPTQFSFPISVHNDKPPGAVEAPPPLTPGSNTALSWSPPQSLPVLKSPPRPHAPPQRATVPDKSPPAIIGHSPSPPQRPAPATSQGPGPGEYYYYLPANVYSPPWVAPQIPMPPKATKPPPALGPSLPTEASPPDEQTLNSPAPSPPMVVVTPLIVNVVPTSSSLASCHSSKTHPPLSPPLSRSLVLVPTRASNCTGTTTLVWRPKNVEKNPRTFNFTKC